MLLGQGVGQSTLLQQYLDRHSTVLPEKRENDDFHNAVIVGLDLEWYEYDSNFVTEIGISKLDPKRITDWTTQSSILGAMNTQHVRVKPNAHLVNGKLCAGHPENFQFGQTRFVTMEEARVVLLSAFSYISNGRSRPVIFIGHAVDNDIREIKGRFGLDLTSLNTIVLTLDTQVMAREVGLAEAGRNIGLGPLMRKFNIIEDYLHNAGNDIVCTVIAACLMLFSRPPSPKFYGELKETLRREKHTFIGTANFCIKCNSSNHTANDCKKKLICGFCTAQESPAEQCSSHATEKCPEAIRAAALTNMLPVPCTQCINFPSPVRFTYKNAYSHPTENFPYNS